MTSEDSRAGRRIALLIIPVAAAFVVRLIVVLSLSEDLTWFDAREYQRLAIGLSETWSYRDADGLPTAYWPPGYPFFVALVYLVFGPSMSAVKTVQAGIGALTCAFVYLIALRLFNRRTAILASAILAVYPLAVYSAGTLYPAVLQTFLIAVLVYLCLAAKESRSALLAAAAGAVAGCSALVAPSAIPALLLAAVWLAWPVGIPSRIAQGTGEDIAHDAARGIAQGAVHGVARGPGQSAAGTPTRRVGKGLVLAAVFLIPMAIVIGSWSARNYRAMGQPVAISTNGGFNFWLGNHPEVTATTGNRMTPSMRRELGAIYARHRNEADRDSVLYAAARSYITADPGRFFMLSAAKALNLWRLYPSPATDVRPAGGREKLLSLLSYGVLLPFGAFWLFRRLRDSDGARLILLLLIGFTVTHALFISKARFRLPLDPYVIVYASAALLALVDIVRGGSGRRG